ncbi:hypothetical protein V1511DRAFT_486520 [Dipodascopsis uninucleata]
MSRTNTGNRRAPYGGSIGVKNKPSSACYGSGATAAASAAVKSAPRSQSMMSMSSAAAAAALRKASDTTQEAGISPLVPSRRASMRASQRSERTMSMSERTLRTPSVERLNSLRSLSKNSVSSFRAGRRSSLSGGYASSIRSIESDLNSISENSTLESNTANISPKAVIVPPSITEESDRSFTPRHFPSRSLSPTKSALKESSRTSRSTSLDGSRRSHPRVSFSDTASPPPTARIDSPLTSGDEEDDEEVKQAVKKSAKYVLDSDKKDSTEDFGTKETVLHTDVTTTMTTSAITTVLNEVQDSAVEVPFINGVKEESTEGIADDYEDSNESHINGIYSVIESGNETAPTIVDVTHVSTTTTVRKNEDATEEIPDTIVKPSPIRFSALNEVDPDDSSDSIYIDASERNFGKGDTSTSGDGLTASVSDMSSLSVSSSKEASSRPSSILKKSRSINQSTVATSRSSTSLSPSSNSENGRVGTPVSIRRHYSLQTSSPPPLVPDLKERAIAELAALRSQIDSASSYRTAGGQLQRKNSSKDKKRVAMKASLRNFQFEEGRLADRLAASGTAFGHYTSPSHSSKGSEIMDPRSIELAQTYMKMNPDALNGLKRTESNSSFKRRNSNTSGDYGFKKVASNDIASSSSNFQDTRYDHSYQSRFADSDDDFEPESSVQAEMHNITQTENKVNNTTQPENKVNNTTQPENNVKKTRKLSHYQQHKLDKQRRKEIKELEKETGKDSKQIKNKKISRATSSHEGFPTETYAMDGVAGHPDKKKKFGALRKLFHLDN